MRPRAHLPRGCCPIASECAGNRISAAAEGISTSIVVRFNKGFKVNSELFPSCKINPTGLTKCLKSTQIGTGVARPMLAAARKQLAGAPRVTLLHHDMSSRLPDIGRFDVVVSCFAIHHLDDPRKRSLYGEVFELLEPGGVFANLEHVASPSERLHRCFYEAIGYPDDWEDPSNKLLDVETQLQWLRELGFEDVDCYWKWLEMALLIGVKPTQRSEQPAVR